MPPLLDAISPGTEQGLRMSAAVSVVALLAFGTAKARFTGPAPMSGPLETAPPGTHAAAFAHAIAAPIRPAVGA